MAGLGKPPIPRLKPFTRRLHPLETARLIGYGQRQRCVHRGCREPATIYAVYYPNALGVRLAQERFLCTRHGAEFAARQHLVIGSAPSDAEAEAAHQRPPAPVERTRLEGMDEDAIAEHIRLGWHCDWPRCHQASAYFAVWDHFTKSGRFRDVARFLCREHAARFAARHGINLASVRISEGGFW